MHLAIKIISLKIRDSNLGQMNMEASYSQCYATPKQSKWFYSRELNLLPKRACWAFGHSDDPTSQMSSVWLQIFLLRLFQWCEMMLHEWVIKNLFCHNFCGKKLFWQMSNTCSRFRIFCATSTDASDARKSFLGLFCLSLIHLQANNFWLDRMNDWNFCL